MPDNSTASTVVSVCLPLAYTCPLLPSRNYHRIIHKSLGTGKDEPTNFDNLKGVREAVDHINSVGQVTASLNDNKLKENTLLVTLTGPAQIVGQDRCFVLRSYYRIERTEVIIDNNSFSELIDSSGILKEGLRTGLDKISDFCNVLIYVTDSAPSGESGSGHGSDNGNDNGHGNGNRQSGHNDLYISIYGDQDTSKLAKLKVQILLDDIQGKFVDSLSLPLSLQPLVAGPNFSNFTTISQQTGVKIYTHDFLPELLAGSSTTDDGYDLDEIFITGLESHVIVAKSMIQSNISKTRTVFKNIVLTIAKLDLFALKYQNRLRDIMHRFGVFIQIPYLGAGRSLVRIQANTPASVENAIIKLMLLTTTLYNASFCVHTGISEDQDTEKEHGFMNQPNVSPDPEYLDRICAASGVTICTRDHVSFDLNGSRNDIKLAISMLANLDIWGPDTLQQVKFRLELSVNQRDFIAGKKNGKILRIMSSGVWIKFLPFNEYNFYVELTADRNTPPLNGLQLLEDELPSEDSTYIPETYHKQLIGAGGWSIQGIMRKYNVFIKFSNGQDLQPNGLAVYHPHNVVIRCPSKNAKNIPLAKNEMLYTVEERSVKHCNTYVRLTRSQRRILLEENCGLIYEIETKTNSAINVSELEPKDDEMVEIRGVGNTSEDAARLLKNNLPEDYEFKIAHSHKFADIISEDNLQFYTNILAPFKTGLFIETQIYAKAKLPDDESAPYHRIVLTYAREHQAGLQTAIQSLTAFLREKELDIIDRGEVSQDPIEHASAMIFGVSTPQTNKRRHNEFQEPDRPPPAVRGRYDHDTSSRPSQYYPRNGSTDFVPPSDYRYKSGGPHPGPSGPPGPETSRPGSYSEPPRHHYQGYLPDERGFSNNGTQWTGEDSRPLYDDYWRSKERGGIRSDPRGPVVAVDYEERRWRDDKDRYNHPRPDDGRYLREDPRPPFRYEGYYQDLP